MGNSLFDRGQRAASGLTAGTREGEVTELEVREGDFGDFVIFKGRTWDNDGNEYRLSATANYSSVKTQKMVRWLLAINGMSPEEFADDGDLSELKETGKVMFVITYERQRRNEETGKFYKDKTEFPNIADMLPLPSVARADNPAARRRRQNEHLASKAVTDGKEVPF